MSLNGTSVLIDEARIKYPRYGYLPDLYVCVIFLVLFSIAALAHLIMAIRSKLWFLIPSLVIGSLGETAGWVGRLWSNRNMESKPPFMLQIITLILSPTFLSAANFILFGTLVTRLGAQYSWISAKYYSIIFLSADIAALVIQGLGGAKASAAQTSHDSEVGGNIMLGGIIIQLIAMAVYSALAGDYFRRLLSNNPARKYDPGHVEMGSVGRDDDRASSTVDFIKPHRDVQRSALFDRRLKLMSLSLALSTTFLLIRAVYRVAELADGWNGTIIVTQIYFNIFDAGMVILALFTLIFLHPSFLLYNGPYSRLTSRS